MMLTKSSLLLTISSFVISFFLSSASRASEESLYDFKWLDKDKKIFVLQNRTYRKKGKFNLSLGGGKTTNGPFVDSFSGQLRAGTFFNETFGAEVFFNKSFGDENSTATSVRNQGGNLGSVPFRRIMQHYFGGMILWSPFYSKVNTFNTIIYYDWIFGLGLGQVTEENNSPEFSSGNTAITEQDRETHISGHWNIGVKVFLSQNFSIRVDFLGTHYRATAPGNSIQSSQEEFYANYDLTAGLEFSF